jgi:acetyl-CoA acyltransferase
MNNLDPRNDPVIVAAARTAVGKAKRGSLATYRPDEMAVMVVQDLLRRVEGLNPEMIDDLILGCAFPEGPQGMNVARVPAETVNRFCASGVQSIAHAAFAIMAGQMEIAIAGGTESMTMVPMTGFKFAPDPHLAENYPEAFTNMGLTAENVAEKYGISREEQDVFSLQSHQKAITAIETGAFEEQIVPLKVNLIEPGSNGHPENRTYTFKIDDGPRRDTSLEALTRLRPAFKQNGTVTAGNSSQMSDGAAGVIIMSRAKADTLGLKPLVRFIAYAVGGVPPEIMGMGPTAAVPKALELAGLSLDEIELIELNEAFAAQGLAVIRELDFNLEITNVNGGAIALGHPLGCTGAKLTVQLINEMKRRDIQFGMVTMCIGGGMGAAGIFENL